MSKGNFDNRLKVLEQQSNAQGLDEGDDAPIYAMRCRSEACQCRGSYKRLRVSPDGKAYAFTNCDGSVELLPYNPPSSHQGVKFSTSGSH